MAAIESIPKPARWDQPFAETALDLEMDDDLARSLITRPPFRDMDPGQFPKTLSLLNIVRNDSAVKRFAPLEVIVRTGDYGHSAFVILEGTVCAVNTPPKAETPREPAPGARKRRPFRRSGGPWNEIRDPRQYIDPSTVNTDTRERFDQTVPATALIRRMHQDEMFGELAALGRNQRTATVYAETEVTLLELRWQGLRDLLRFSPDFAQRVHSQYRRFALEEYMATHSPFGAAARGDSMWANRLDGEERASILSQTTFESVGGFDWFREFGVRGDTDAVTRIAAEGDYVDSLILIRAGFARISYDGGRDSVSLGVLRRGDVFGLHELIHNYRFPDDPIPFRQSLHALGYTDVLRVPVRLVEEYVLDRFQDADELDRWARSYLAVSSDDRDPRVQPEQLEFLIDQRIVNGTRAMLIDNTRCVGCDDCVRACASVHDNNPRFIRQGPKMGDYTIAHACMHCADAVCMIDCPTGAIYRDRGSGMVVINDDTCIGCGNCAIGCPYDNIQLVTVQDRDGRLIRDRSHAPIRKATKCDFCLSTPNVAPACENACPHDAMIRIDMGDLNLLGQWLDR